MKKIKEKISLVLEYFQGVEKPEIGYFEGGVVSPKFLNELSIKISDDPFYDESTDSFKNSGKFQINISGSNRSYEELGKYFLALSKLETKDRDYHDHFEEIEDIHLIVHAS